jgi:hypothetical protein
LLLRLSPPSGAGLFRRIKEMTLLEVLLLVLGAVVVWWLIEDAINE